MSRVPTGISGLDTILNGGLLRGGCYLVLGAPGAGKTILCNQMCFNHARAGGRVIYITLLSESHTRLIAHLRGLTFFDPAFVADAVQYFSGYSVLQRGGLRGLLELVRQEARAQQATLVVLDGLSTIETLVDDDMSIKVFIHDLQIALDFMGCTTLLQAQPIEEHAVQLYTMVDGVIALHDETWDLHTIRELEVTKFRGSGYLRGRHRFEITDAGITVYPRLEATAARAPDTGARDRVGFGIASLDTMLDGGLLAGSSSLLLGPPGSGKTVLGLHLLAAGARANEPGLYFGFYEPPPRLIATANNVGLTFDAAATRGLIHILWQPPLENLLDVLAERLMRAVREHGIRRLVVDGIDGFADAAIRPGRLNRLLAALFNELRAEGVTSLWTRSTTELFNASLRLPASAGAELVDNLIYLRYVELHSQLYRLISVLKMRESGYDPAIHEFRISSEGIAVQPTSESAESILRQALRLASTSPVRRRNRPRS